MSGFLQASAEYEHFSFGNSVIPLNAIIIAAMAGVFIAALASYYNKNVLGKFVRALGKNGCTDKESARTVTELGFADNKPILLSLKKGTLCRMIKCVGREELAKRLFESENNADGGKGKHKKDIITQDVYKLDFTKDRFYIPKEKMDSMQHLFGEKGTSVLALVLTAVFCIAAGAALIAAVPWFISLFDSAIG